MSYQRSQTSRFFAAAQTKEWANDKKAGDVFTRLHGKATTTMIGMNTQAALLQTRNPDIKPFLQLTAGAISNLNKLVGIDSGLKNAFEGQ